MTRHWISTTNIRSLYFSTEPWFEFSKTTGSHTPNQPVLNIDMVDPKRFELHCTYVVLTVI